MQKNHSKKSGRPFNIAMIGQKRVPSREGGIEVVVEELSKRMVAQGHGVTCYNRSGHNVAGRQFDVKKENSYEGICLVHVPTVDVRGLAAFSSALMFSV